MDDKRVKLCKNKEGVRYILPSYVLDSIDSNKRCEINEYKPVWLLYTPDNLYLLN